MEEKNSSKVICLFFPPLINNFNFQAGTEIEFFNPQSGLKINQFLSKLAGKKLRKLVLINYPTEEKQVDELRSELAQIGLKITEVLLCNLINYELMADIQNKYLLCPKCEKTFARATIDENKQKSPFFHKLDISQEKEIVSGELGKRILKAI